MDGRWLGFNREPLMLKRLHHVAYRCLDALETTEFYTEVLGLKLAASLVQEKIPSLQKNEPHNHIFFELGDGSFIAFFDIIGDEHSPTSVEQDWAQHLALEIDSIEIAEKICAKLIDRGIEVVGPTEHEMCTSWYFYDPSGHRLEMAYRTDSLELWAQLDIEAPKSLAQWQALKSA